MGESVLQDNVASLGDTMMLSYTKGPEPSAFEFSSAIKGDGEGPSVVGVFLAHLD